jgi:sec-independent protein translocase protein TatB
MFDFSFSEILIIFVLALIVLGPEKLPSVVRRVGRWVGQARAMARQIQEQLEEEIDLEGRHRSGAPAPPASGETRPSATDPTATAEQFTPVVDAPTHGERPADAPVSAAESAEPPASPAATVHPHEPRV